MMRIDRFLRKTAALGLFAALLLCVSCEDPDTEIKGVLEMIEADPHFFDEQGEASSATTNGTSSGGQAQSSTGTATSPSIGGSQQGNNGWSGDGTWDGVDPNPVLKCTCSTHQHTRKSEPHEKSTYVRYYLRAKGPWGKAYKKEYGLYYPKSNELIEWDGIRVAAEPVWLKFDPIGSAAADTNGMEFKWDEKLSDPENKYSPYPPPFKSGSIPSDTFISGRLRLSGISWRKGTWEAISTTI